ncbi:hypothetical protein ESCAB7627_2448 [Escherichia albertii TW07627]|uniref:Uncharacterized protein n=1 Tax=Escherichia albertii (strain TW07627) TaxID=502347 RepID=A0ABC9NNE9_ESCAT|nr:hypothetical protein ESCAB7627_2448 [Escherichia albertii TW07627]
MFLYKLALIVNKLHKNVIDIKEIMKCLCLINKDNTRTIFLGMDGKLWK